MGRLQEWTARQRLREELFSYLLRGAAPTLRMLLLVLLSLLPAGESVTIQCCTKYQDLPAPAAAATEVICPDGCLKQEFAVWGTDIYTDDSSICRAAINAGKVSNAGSRVRMEKRPGQSSYQESTRNGVTTRSYGAWTGSFIFTSANLVLPTTSPPQPPEVPIQCSTSARQLTQNTAEVICPEGCLQPEVTVWGTDIYTDDSSICRAAINAGKASNAGGRVKMEKRPGQSSYQESTRNGVTTRSYGAWPGSFIFTSANIVFPTTSPPQPPEVPVQCSTTARQLTQNTAEVTCPEGCLKQEVTVWGTDIYTDDSSICRAAINAGKVSNAGGRVRMEKRPGQSSYQESTRNGVTTRSYGAWTGSFIFTSANIVFPTTSTPQPPEVPVQCSTTARQLTQDTAEVICPDGCLKQETAVWGTDIYTDDSSICRAAINAGKVSNAGGRARIVKRPGQSSYQESTRNGVTTRSYGAWPGSFIFTSATIVLPPTSPPQPPEGPVQCSTTARQLTQNTAEVICPEGCLKQEVTVWGTDVYTDDSSICRAAINAGKVSNAGGRVRMEKRPGQSSYQESTRNGVTTRSYGAWAGSFIFTSASIVIPPTSPPQPPEVPVQCTTTARQLNQSTAEVICPEGCLKQEVTVWGTDVYTDDSSICRAAINAGKVSNAGGRVRMEKRPGQSSYQESTRNGVTTRSYGAWTGSFIFTSASIVIPPTSPPQLPEVPVQCTTTARQLNQSTAEVICPEGCLKQEVTVWGTDVYTDDSSICRAAINVGKVSNAGGRVRMEKRPGQSSYQESTRNGVTTRSYGAWAGSFIFTSASIVIPSTSPLQLPEVPVQCSTTARQLTQSTAEVICPEGCLKQEVTVWGTDVYTDDSSICRAAINVGKVSNAGGRVRMEKRPGQSSYQESTRNGVTTRSYGAWTGSFIFTSASIVIPPTSPPQLPEVPLQCTTTARQLTQSTAEVTCPEGCLKQEVTVWGTDVYTDDSSICRAAINEGKVSNAGGRVRMEKRPGQSSYQESTRNGVTTRSYGAWTGSFIFTSASIVIPPTSPPQLPEVPVQCTTTARQLTQSTAEVICPEGCLKQEVTVWGTDVYTDDSSICRAAINAGKVRNAGGRVRMEKRPGQSSYQESTRNGVTTRSYGAWTGSFIFTSASIVIPPTSPPQLPEVPVQCTTTARQLTQSTAEVICPEGCLKQEVTVWGTDVYTDDSSICRAAINAGKVSNAGGRVRMEKRSGQSSYQESTRNGVTTRSYGDWTGSFIFTSASIVIPPTSPPQLPEVPVQCTTTARQLTQSTAEVICPEGCLKQEVTVWGTDIYTDDSSICRAAINAGKVSNAGGRVRMEKRPGQSSYQESTRNGITTRSYGSWSGSFIFTSVNTVIPTTGPAQPHEVPVQCSTTARQLIQNTTEVLCPAGCLAQEVTVWGTDIYTDDSSICRAAINACRLTNAGGRVRVEKQLGQSCYQGSTRNGVTTQSYEDWPRSFKVTSPWISAGSEDCSISTDQLPIG
ncbi:uncharacterized protein [Pleurodeles waltl]|uniref:uncharacterized protein isoform X2 n=1 Tax=Pleurodeles waltl TaxID=8319 RepID=UPI0037098610